MYSNSKKILNYFDFDATLYYTRLFQKKYREHLKYLDQQSLAEELNNFWITSTLQQVKFSQNNKNTYTVMCTARIDNDANRNFLLPLFKMNGIEFDYVFLRNPNHDIPTYKADVAEYVIKNHPEITHVNVWEDCEENIFAIEKKVSLINAFTMF